MNQITRCPNCSTSFRVTDDQLAAHQGKVRCGRCTFVFNARDFLQTIASEATTSQKKNEGIASKVISDNTPEAIPQESTIQAIEQTTSVVAPTDSTPVEKKPAAAAAENKTSSGNEKDLLRALARLAKKSRTNKAQRPRKALKRNTIMASAESAIDIAAASESSALIDDDAEYRPILDEDDPLFKPVSPNRFNALWAAGSFILVLVLIAQLAYNFRLPLSQEFPALRPKLIALCSYLQCDMPLPQEAQLLRSEWSELTYIPDHPTLVQVKATLRNLAGFEQALPKLELTLTDENEKLVARKIFTPQQYLAQSEPGLASLLPNDEIHAFLQLDLGDLRSTGYSLYWFYD